MSQGNPGRKHPWGFKNNVLAEKAIQPTSKGGIPVAGELPKKDFHPKVNLMTNLPVRCFPEEDAG